MTTGRADDDHAITTADHGRQQGDAGQRQRPSNAGIEPAAAHRGRQPLAYEIAQRTPAVELGIRSDAPLGARRATRSPALGCGGIVGRHAGKL